MTETDDDEGNDWSRPFRKVHRDLKTLKSFAVVNQNAALDLLSSFMKENF